MVVCLESSVRDRSLQRVLAGQRLRELSLVSQVGSLGRVVVTPLVGVGVLSVAEDVLDRWVIKKLELKTNKVGRGVLRVVLNPTRAFAMLMGFKKPWHRDNR